MSDEFDALATEPAAMVRIAPTDRCDNEYLIVTGVPTIGQAIACDAGCDTTHQVRGVVPIDLVRTVEIPAPQPERSREGHERGLGIGRDE